MRPGTLYIKTDSLDSQYSHSVLLQTNATYPNPARSNIRANCLAIWAHRCVKFDKTLYLSPGTTPLLVTHSLYLVQGQLCIQLDDSFPELDYTMLGAFAFCIPIK
jgi:hypothetical protein